MQLSQKIEALLFYKNEPVNVAWLAKVTKSDESKITEALLELENSLAERGVVLLRNNDEVSLGTHPDASSFIESLIKDDLGTEIGKAGPETLTIILYAGPLSRSEIDYIRGVNSQFIVRHLLVRGLVERLENKEDARRMLYTPTLRLLSFLGITKIDDLPNYQEIREKLKNIKANPVI